MIHTGHFSIPDEVIQSFEIPDVLPGEPNFVNTLVIPEPFRRDIEQTIAERFGVRAAALIGFWGMYYDAIDDEMLLHEDHNQPTRVITGITNLFGEAFVLVQDDSIAMVNSGQTVFLDGRENPTHGVQCTSAPRGSLITFTAI